MTEEEVRLIARVTAEETTRILRSSFRSGHEGESGDELPFLPVSVSVTEQSGTVPVCLKARTFSVARSGGCIGTLRLYGRNGRSRDVELRAGLHFDDLPLEKVELVVTTAGLDEVLFLVSELPRAFRPPPVCCDEAGSVVTISSPSPLSGAARPGNTVSTLQGAQGYRYQLLDVSVELDTDANAANRYLVLDLYDDDGTTIRQTVGSDLVVANQLGHFAGGPSSANVLNLESGHLTQSFFLAQDVVLSTGVSLMRATITAGVAGDAYKIAARYRRTPA